MVSNMKFYFVSSSDCNNSNCDGEIYDHVQ